MKVQIIPSEFTFDAHNVYVNGYLIGQITQNIHNGYYYRLLTMRRTVYPTAEEFEAARLAAVDRIRVLRITDRMRS